MNKYYTPELEEFHVGFRYESKTKIVYTGNKKDHEGEWKKQEANERILNTLYDKVYRGINYTAYSYFRVKYLDRDDIEKLGWEYSGKTQDLQFKLVKEIQPFNLTYRSFRLQYSLEDHRLRVIGFEYDGFGPDEEVLFLGICNNYNELKFIMKRIGLIE